MQVTHRLVNRMRSSRFAAAVLMLAALSIFAAPELTARTTNQRVADNLKASQEAIFAVHSAIDTTVAGAAFVSDPDSVAAAAYAIDIDGDGSRDIEARIEAVPACRKVRVVKVSELDPRVASDAACMASSASAHSGIDYPGAVGGNSLCAETEWSMRAEVNNGRAGAYVSEQRDLAMRVMLADASNACP